VSDGSLRGPVKTLALVVEYDGSAFCGFQRQTAVASVAGELGRILGILLGHPIALSAAGRTDAGVHATGQVISFETTSDFPTARIPIAASALLRDSRIAVLRAAQRPAGFSARHDALSRSYRYRILNRLAPSPLLHRRVFHVRAALDVGAMQAVADRLIGRRDFATFSSGPPHEKGTTREIFALSIERNGDEIDVVVTADAFLHHMVRIVVGTLIEVGRGRLALEDVDRMLAAKDRRLAGFTAPAHALYLERVTYANPL